MNSPVSASKESIWQVEASSGTPYLKKVSACSTAMCLKRGSPETLLAQNINDKFIIQSTITQPGARSHDLIKFPLGLNLPAKKFAANNPRRLLSSSPVSSYLKTEVNRL